MSDDLIKRLRAVEGKPDGYGGAGRYRNPDGPEAADEIGRLRGALEWYAEQASLCRLITSDGDPGRHRLANDGGKRARAALETGAPDWHGHRARAALDGDGELDA